MFPSLLSNSFLHLSISEFAFLSPRMENDNDTGVLPAVDSATHLVVGDAIDRVFGMVSIIGIALASVIAAVFGLHCRT